MTCELRNRNGNMNTEDSTEETTPLVQNEKEICPLSPERWDRWRLISLSEALQV